MCAACNCSTATAASRSLSGQADYCAGRPRLTGFEIVALRAPEEAVVDAVAARCDRMGVAHTDIMRIPGYVAGMDIPDPDGTIIRILWHDPQGMSGFLGVEYDAAGRPSPYREPRIDAPGRPE